MKIASTDHQAFKVVCEPSRRNTTVGNGVTLLEAITQIGLPLGQSCDSEALCGFCRVHVLEGASHLSEPAEDEIKVLRSLGAEQNERLACCAHVIGNVTVRADYW